MPSHKNHGPITGRRIRIALIGCGRIAAKHFDAIDAHRAPEVEAAGVRAIVTDTMMRSPEIATELARRTLGAVA